MAASQARPPSTLTRTRLDELLVARGLYPSRSRARDAILRGAISVDGNRAAKPAQMVEPNAMLASNDKAQSYVSRAALKLAFALDHFAINPAGKSCLDIGASTGGFTQILLERGASHVTAIDVGHGQMQLKSPSLTTIEGLNARDLKPIHLPNNIELVVCDVSFISLKQALPPALALAQPGAELLALIKPQFEVGRMALGKSGIVNSPELHEKVCAEIAEFIAKLNWDVLGIEPSPLLGGEGNREFLLAARKPRPLIGG